MILGLCQHISGPRHKHGWDGNRPAACSPVLERATGNQTAGWAAIIYARSEPTRQDRPRCYLSWRTSRPSTGADDRQPSEGD